MLATISGMELARPGQAQAGARHAGGVQAVIICIQLQLQLQPLCLTPRTTINYFVSLSNRWVQSYLRQHGGPVKLSTNLLYWVITLELFSSENNSSNTGDQ